VQKQLTLIEQGGEWAPEPVWTLWRGEKFLAYAGKSKIAWPRDMELHKTKPLECAFKH
jgi:hypothetical protein